MKKPKNNLQTKTFDNRQSKVFQNAHYEPIKKPEMSTEAGAIMFTPQQQRRRNNFQDDQFYPEQDKRGILSTGGGAVEPKQNNKSSRMAFDQIYDSQDSIAGDCSKLISGAVPGTKATPVTIDKRGGGGPSSYSKGGTTYSQGDMLIAAK